MWRLSNNFDFTSIWLKCLGSKILSSTSHNSSYQCVTIGRSVGIVRLRTKATEFSF
jgi:hypothetical protein